MQDTVAPTRSNGDDMTDREIDRLLWGAFLLGARVVAEQGGRQLGASEINSLGRLLRQIAENESTLEDPTALAAQNPEMGPLLMRLETVNIRSNRDLAKCIFEGYIIATDVKE
jgi:hypothetical protein